MLACPQCGASLVRSQTPAGIFWPCPRGDGRAVTVSLLRRTLKPETVSALWAGTFRPGTPRQRPCPSCRQPMQVIGAPLPGKPFVLDVCAACQFVWFDAQEFEAMPALPPPAPPKPETPRALREAVALAQVEAEAQRQAEAPPGWDDLRNLPALFGLPVEVETNELRRQPWATLLTAGLVALVSVAAFAHPALFQALALVPAEIGRGGGLTLLTSFFVHGGWLHLISNLYFLTVFGDNVEDYLGRARWLALVGAATLAGGLLHVLGDPRAEVPCAGASGGISGLLAFYALRFPRARLGLRVWLRWGPPAPWFTLPAWGWFTFWAGLQVLGAALQLGGLGQVSALAHLGGALVGVMAWALWRNIELPPEALPVAAVGEAPPRRRG
jgi:membrane associated rhomboid family serine protease/Zn-finger nucleic acid-binding protein